MFSMLFRGRPLTSPALHGPLLSEMASFLYMEMEVFSYPVSLLNQELCEPVFACHQLGIHSPYGSRQNLHRAWSVWELEWM